MDGVQESSFNSSNVKCSGLVGVYFVNTQSIWVCARCKITFKRAAQILYNNDENDIYLQVESDCKPKECGMDKGSLSCGFFQIKFPYWVDCYKHKPGKVPANMKSGATISPPAKCCLNRITLVGK